MDMRRYKDFLSKRYPKLNIDTISTERTNAQNISQKIISFNANNKSRNSFILSKNNSNSKETNNDGKKTDRERFPKIKHIININQKFTKDLIAEMEKFKSKKNFKYKQTINLQRLNDYIIYEETKKKMSKNKIFGIKNSIDFTIPLTYRRLDNHCKKEDLISCKYDNKINLNDILIHQNSTMRKSMTQNKCKNYYLKKNIRLKKVLFMDI